MRIDVITLFPDFIRTAADIGVVGRAKARGLIEIATWNPRDFALDNYRSADERPYGGGPGMVMKVEPVRSALRDALRVLPAGSLRVYLGADGRKFEQRMAREACSWPGLALVAGRYEGIDERFIEQEVDEQWSIGDYVLSGGELPALVVIDAIARLMPGTLGSMDSALQESFSDGLVDWPHYTRPQALDGHEVPAVLASGDHAAVQRWRLQQALGRTWLRRPELLEQRGMSDAERELLEEFKNEARQR